MLAVALTAAVVVALTVFAFQTKWDFTMMGGVLFAALWIMIMFSTCPNDFDFDFDFAIRL